MYTMHIYVWTYVKYMYIIDILYVSDMCLLIYVCVYVWMENEDSYTCMYMSVCVCIYTYVCLYIPHIVVLMGRIFPLKTSPEAAGKPWNYVIDRIAVH